MRGSLQSRTIAFLTAGMAVIVASLAGGGAQAAKFKVLVNFGNHKLGYNPVAPVLIDQQANLYTTAFNGGAGRGGTVVELKRKGGGYKYRATTIYRFQLGGGEGVEPRGPLVMDTQGNLYGEAVESPNSSGGIVFELSPVANQITWNEKILYRFCSQENCRDGNQPFGGLTYGGASTGSPYDGTSPLFGVTTEGGANNGGTVFQLTNNSGSWVETVLYNFCSQAKTKCRDGKGPVGVLSDSAGNLFGTTFQGGNKMQSGVAFELSPNAGSWTYAPLHSFCSVSDCVDGAYPNGQLIFDGTGAILGTTISGGASCRRKQASGCGTVFRLVPNGTASQETVLHSFCQQRDCRDGDVPVGGVAIDTAGDLYGATALGGGHDTGNDPEGAGTIYKLSGSTFEILHKFCSAPNCTDGDKPQAGVTIDSRGVVFGTTVTGGEFGDSNLTGTLFEQRP